MSEHEIRNRWHNGRKTRIDDIEKAHVMALASKEQEQAAAAVRHIAERALEMGDVEMFAEVISDAIANTDDPKYVPSHFKEGLELAQLDGLEFYTVDDVAEAINTRQMHADEMAKFAGDGYDKLKATKR